MCTAKVIPNVSQCLVGCLVLFLGRTVQRLVGRLCVNGSPTPFIFGRGCVFVVPQTQGTLRIQYVVGSQLIECEQNSTTRCTAPSFFLDGPVHYQSTHTPIVQERFQFVGHRGGQYALVADNFRFDGDGGKSLYRVFHGWVLCYREVDSIASNVHTEDTSGYLAPIERLRYLAGGCQEFGQRFGGWHDVC